MNWVAELEGERCFAPGIPFGEQLAAVHVPFDDLVGVQGHEARTRHEVERGGLVLVIGETGEGKSGLVSSACSIEHGYLAVTVPVSVPHPDGVPVALLPSLVLAGFARVLAPTNTRAADDADRAASGVRRRKRLTGSFDLKLLRLEIGDLDADRPGSTREQLDAIAQAAAATAAFGLRPVLVLDDTDKWASSADRLRAGREFFDQALNALIDLQLPIVANAHPRYFETTGRPAHFDTIVKVPRVPQAAIASILDRRVRLATEGRAGVMDLFAPDALEVLGDAYASDPSITMRKVVQLANESLIEAAEAGMEGITVGAVENALADR